MLLLFIFLIIINTFYIVAVVVVVVVVVIVVLYILLPDLTDKFLYLLNVAMQVTRIQENFKQAGKLFNNISGRE